MESQTLKQDATPQTLHRARCVGIQSGEFRHLRADLNK
jgi:hypothetical protein